MSQNDPTDHALAAIASILEKPAAKPDDLDQAETIDRTGAAAPVPAVEGRSGEIDGYSKFGPGPLDSLRFRWSARRDANGSYYVDETIGGSSRPVSSGPMPKEDVIKFIDEREREARRRYEALRNEMTSGPSERGIDDRYRGDES